jgi:hypothetical protein
VTGEIDDVMTQRNLPSKTGFGKGFAQQAPHGPFGVGCIGPEPAGALRRSNGGTVFHAKSLTTKATPPQPSPSRGGEPRAHGRDDASEAER